MATTDTLHEVKYECNTPRCGNKQTLRYWPDESILPVACCTKCRAGFGMELDKQMMTRTGMFPAVAKVN